MLFLSMLILATAGIFVISCGKSGSSYNSNPGGGTPPPPPGHAVSIKDMAFSPASISVTAGTTVTWTNNDAMTHTVTADDASFDSGNMAQGATYSHKFTTAGTVAYHCKIHPTMTASVAVQ
jgi:plastocyanin